MTQIFIIFLAIIAVNLLLIKISCNKTKFTRKSKSTVLKTAKVHSIPTNQLEELELSSTGS